MTYDDLKKFRVCGLYHEIFFPWSEKGVYPTFDICSCCGTEFGYQDFTYEAIKASRELWLSNGAKWIAPN